MATAGGSQEFERRDSPRAVWQSGEQTLGKGEDTWMAKGEILLVWPWERCLKLVLYLSHLCIYEESHTQAEGRIANYLTRLTPTDCGSRYSRTVRVQVDTGDEQDIAI